MPLAAFMNIGNVMSHDYSDEFMMEYLEDILMYNQTWEEHMSHVDIFL